MTTNISQSQQLSLDNKMPPYPIKSDNKTAVHSQAVHR